VTPYSVVAASHPSALLASAGPPHAARPRTAPDAGRYRPPIWQPEPHAAPTANLTASTSAHGQVPTVQARAHARYSRRMSAASRTGWRAACSAL
jgi:hypothetical protein